MNEGMVPTPESNLQSGIDSIKVEGETSSVNDVKEAEPYTTQPAMLTNNHPLYIMVGLTVLKCHYIKPHVFLDRSVIFSYLRMSKCCVGIIFVFIWKLAS